MGVRLRDIRPIGRRAWLARAGRGLVAVWAAGGGLAAALVRFRPAIAAQEAAQAAPEILRARIESDLPPLGRINVQAYVVVRGREAAIVDTLLPGNADTIAAVLRSAGLGYDVVRHVILTHWHPDHTGSAQDIAALASGATFYTGALDLPRIASGNAQFGVPPVRQPLRPLNDGDEVFGLRVIATPGHTLGHISLLDPAGSTLIAGDAFNNLGGNLSGSILGFTEDYVQATRTLERLAAMQFERAVMGHGEAITSGAPTALAQLLARYPRASDGQSLEIQMPDTIAAFAALYGDRAGAEWVRQHEAELARRR